MSSICGPDDDYGRKIIHCPTCQRRRRMVLHWLGAWYGQRATCLGCGDSWCDGEMYPRPFQRGWREKSRKQALADWQRAAPARAYRKAIKADIRMAIGR